jgi:hypothetical protein
VWSMLGVDPCSEVQTPECVWCQVSHLAMLLVGVTHAPTYLGPNSLVMVAAVVVHRCAGVQRERAAAAVV